MQRNGPAIGRIRAPRTYFAEAARLRPNLSAQFLLLAYAVSRLPFRTARRTLRPDLRPKQHFRMTLNRSNSVHGPRFEHPQRPPSLSRRGWSRPSARTRRAKPLVRPVHRVETDGVWP